MTLKKERFVSTVKKIIFQKIFTFKGSFQAVISKNEIELLNDWDTFKSDEAAYDNSSILSSSVDNSSSLEHIELKHNSGGRDTRLGFIDNNEEKSTESTSTQNECTNNITVRSSASSDQYNQEESECGDMSEERSLLVTPRNGPFEFYTRAEHVSNSQHSNKRPESQQSVLSNFISNLKFEDNFKSAEQSFVNANENLLGKYIYKFIIHLGFKLVNSQFHT